MVQKPWYQHIMIYHITPTIREVAMPHIPHETSVISTPSIHPLAKSFPLKILIAGSREDTHNYQRVLTCLGFGWDTLPSTQNLPSFSSAPLNCIWNTERYAGLLLPGGGDLPHTLAGASVTSMTNLDCWQLYLLHSFVSREKPVLGICKGMQIINLYFGGTLYSNLFCASSHCWDSNRKKDQMHHTFSLPDTFLYDLYGEAFYTNSAHHQGCAQLGGGLLPAQYSHDCVVEAIYHVSLPILGLQWHPERMSLDFHTPDMIDGIRIFSHFSTGCLK